jgi:tRNA modification GTPase
MPTGNDTIVALATPPGTGGVGVVRISGGDSERIARAMLGSLPEPRVATYATFANSSGMPVDQGLALYFPGPASFTGESVVELHGHGGPVVMSLLVDAVVELGARLAEPGEFSKRAFLNDKLDLAQAEAIADLIDSGTAQAARAALRSLSGMFSDAVNELVEQLTALRMYVEAAIDFPEEEIAACAASFDALLSKAAVGRVMRDGYQVVIVGKPNAGKSSLMNRLSGEDTAIVTEIAGTTRDVLRERINIDGLAVELVDTAGLRDNPDRIEEEGIRRARKARTVSRSLLCATKSTSVATGRASSRETGRS